MDRGLQRKCTVHRLEDDVFEEVKAVFSRISFRHSFFDSRTSGGITGNEAGDNFLRRTPRQIWNNKLVK
jgi:hypothetical protein